MNAVARQSEGRVLDYMPSCEAGFHRQYEIREARRLIYFANDLSEVKRFKDYVAKTNNQHLWVAHSNSAEFLQQIGAKQGTGTQFMQTDQAHNMTWSSAGYFNICSSTAIK